ncbi:MAG: hypothetical protein A2255_02990 [Candidatus Melainabacteria bacterium RIFOXYA2_FULL_32_9]|nr:MAG: hypothetical protein A2255_02990 [Candidatus Melainabacteria bacterium RIFOXYA2_FULL_32_9]
MPSGKMHDSIAFISIIPMFLLGGCVFNNNPQHIYVFAFAVTFSQLMFGPDLDVQSRQYKRWGLLRWIWLPYMKLFAHRSRFTHGIIFGPIFRFIYLLIVLILLFISTVFVIGHLLGNNFFLSLLFSVNQVVRDADISSFTPFLLPFIFGIFLGAAIHTITDKVFSFFKNLV